jgi:membrane protease YdiL (CAAX protease family)
MPINAAVILYLLSLNGIASLLFGYLFWRHGLESAMVAHFCADIVLQVIAPALLG